MFTDYVSIVYTEAIVKVYLWRIYVGESLMMLKKLKKKINIIILKI